MGEIKMEEDYMRFRRHCDGDEYNFERRRNGREREKEGGREKFERLM